MSHRPRPMFLIVLVIPVLAAILAAGYFLVVSMTDDPDPAPAPPETPQATVISNVSSPESDAGTPEPNAGTSETGSLTDLMSYAPDRLSDGSLPLPEVATYSNISAWLRYQGLPEGSLTEDQAASLALPPILAGRGLDSEWEATYGFSLADVDQVLAIGQAPDYIMVLRGQFDSDAMMAAWTSGAYQAVAVDGTTIWSVHPVETDAVDLSNPSSRLAMGSFNNLVLLEDGTLIATAKFSRMQSVLPVINGEAPSIAANGDIEMLLELEAGDRGYLTAVIARGDFLESAPADTRVTLPAATSSDRGANTVATPDPGEMPEVRMVLFGLMAPDDTVREATPVATPSPDVAAVVTLALVLDEDVVAGTMDAIGSRFETEISLTTGEPFADSWTLSGSISDEDSPLLEIEMMATSTFIDWIQLVDNRDFGFLTWTGNETP
ncbi:MAG: hypothetical protein WKF81_09005 [Thermomicrobiales bacterium]